MRPIKLRFWRFGILQGYRELKKGSIIDMPWEWDDADEFTGLTDKNGIEIYEGDIVVSMCYPFYSDLLRNYVGVVEWDETNLMWAYELYAVSDRVAGRACGSGLAEIEEWEVIGNRFENPELLEQS